jgi:hypothetical protein
VPQPACLFYGEVRDEYGIPYLDGAEVILRVDGRECSRWPVQGILAPAVNFKLALELDAGSGVPYAAYAARPGQPLRLWVRTPTGERPVMETRALAVGQPGELIAVYVSTGTDTDGDGLPDEWEQQLVENSNGALRHLLEVRPEDDLDGDGVSNGDEYRGGTYAFLGDDFLAIEEMATVVGGQLRLRFLTTRGITYRVDATRQLGGEIAWQRQPFALTESEGALSHDALVGDGFYVSVYVRISEAHHFYRLVAQ